MSVDRKIFEGTFSKGSQPEWPCPACDREILKGVEGSFRLTETKDSKDSRKIPDWEPEWIRYNYSCAFRCTNPKCGETVENIGTGSVSLEVDFDDEKGYMGDYYDTFTPTYFIPHLNLFKIPSSTPRDVRESINKSFSLFFANTSAATNQMRIALEQLLDHLKVKQYETVKGRKYKLSLHKTIGLIPNKVVSLKEHFMAVKWLGNDGSHVEGVSKDNVMDAYDIFELILEEIFGLRMQLVNKLTKRINKGRRKK